MLTEMKCRAFSLPNGKHVLSFMCMGFGESDIFSKKPSVQERDHWATGKLAILAERGVKVEGIHWDRA